MENLIDENKTLEDIINGKIKVHIIPIYNPEGYLITTSAIRKVIPRDMPEIEAQEIS